MVKYTLGDTRLTVMQDELAIYQGNGSVVLNSQRTRPLWFDGRFLSARDLAREQDYFLQRQSNLGQAAGFGVIHGLQVDTPPASNPNADGQTIIIRSGQGLTPAGELVLLQNDLTIHLSDLPDEENLDVQFGISSRPNNPLRNRTGVYVVALRPVEFTANPITSYPTSIQGSSTSHDGDIVEATAVTLVPYPDPFGWMGGTGQDASLRRAALARQIFVTQNATQLSEAVLPLAVISLQSGTLEWVDPYLVRRDAGPEYSGLQFGLTDRATRQAFLMQFDAQLQETVLMRQAAGLAANFAASSYFQALPPTGRFPLASITLGSQSFSQVFFPQQLDVRLSVVPVDELPGLVEDSMSLPPIDLTLPADQYADVAVFALVPVPRAGFAALKNNLPTLAPAPVPSRILSFRAPFQLLQLYQGAVSVVQGSGTENAAWAAALSAQTYGFYIRRRSSPTFVDFTTDAAAGPIPTPPSPPVPLPPAPSPAPVPTPDPTPGPAPDPVPPPDPTPPPDPGPPPAPTPDPAPPVPIPDPGPVPIPRPFPGPIPRPGPLPGPVPRPMAPKPKPEASPKPSPKKPGTKKPSPKKPSAKKTRGRRK